MRLTLLFTLIFTISSAAATVVRVDTPVGSFYIDLFEDEAPRTVANFLNYLRDGDYENSFIHRSSVDFVIQGGGFVFENGEIGEVPEDASIANEFGVPNTRGTIAMAKISGDPDSATSQWFINVEDNPDLDRTNGGFSVFGQVMGDGMQVVDVINSIDSTRTNTELPLLRFDDGEEISRENIVFTTITEVPLFTANGGLSGAWFNADTSGQGWLFDVIDQPDRRQVFMAWFTYDTQEPPADETAGFGSQQHRWFTGIGDLNDNTAVIPIRVNSGGVFNDPRDTEAQTVGTLTVRFESCRNATVTFDFDDDALGEETVPITRLSPDRFCAELVPPADD